MPVYRGLEEGVERGPGVERGALEGVPMREPPIDGGALRTPAAEFAPDVGTGRATGV